MLFFASALHATFGSLLGRCALCVPPQMAGESFFLVVHILKASPWSQMLGALCGGEGAGSSRIQQFTSLRCRREIAIMFIWRGTGSSALHFSQVGVLASNQSLFMSRIRKFAAVLQTDVRMLLARGSASLAAQSELNSLVLVC